MERIELAAQPRKETGKQSTKKVRKEGHIPAILYGHGMTPLAIQVVVRDLYKTLHTKAGENVLINLNVEGVKRHVGAPWSRLSDHVALAARLTR